MTLDKNDLQNGLKFIVGTWRADFVVNAFSNDLSHIPASQWKSEDGGDLSLLTVDFYEDHTLEMSGLQNVDKVRGTWEQTGYTQFHWAPDGLSQIPEGPMKSAAQTLEMQEGNLVFAIGFLAVSMKKIANGVVTEPEKEPDIGDLTPSASDLLMTGIVGVYGVLKAPAFIGGEFGAYSREEIEKENAARIAAGETDEEEAAESLRAFEMKTEFTADHRVIEWMKIPEGVSKEEIDEALKSGEIKEVKDGMFPGTEKEWKAVGGKYYLNSGEKREAFGEELSAWDELILSEDGTLPLSGGMIVLKKQES